MENTYNRQEYINWINSIDNEFRKSARLEFLNQKKEILERHINKFQIFLNKKLKIMPVWYIEFIQELKDTWIVNLSNATVFQNVDGYKVYEKRTPTDRFDCGLSYIERMNKLNRLLHEIEFVEGNGMYKDIDLEVIRRIPISDYIEFSQGFAKCIWHDEKTPSMKYYQETNSVYCFGCNKGGGVIDVVMQLQQLDFRNAIKFLCNISVKN